MAAYRILRRFLGERGSPYLRAVVEEGAAIAFGLIPTDVETKTSEGGFEDSGRRPSISFSHRCRWVILISPK
jgi:hypothetical protein